MADASSLLAVALASAVAVASLPLPWILPQATALALLCLALSAGCLLRAWPAAAGPWPWGFLVAGCLGGLVAFLSLAAPLQGQRRVDVALESASFDLLVSGLLEQRHCPSLVAALSADLELLPSRPLLAAPARWQAWDRAAALGCVDSRALHRARQALEQHAASAPLPPGMSRARAQSLMRSPPGLP